MDALRRGGQPLVDGHHTLLSALSGRLERIAVGLRLQLPPLEPAHLPVVRRPGGNSKLAPAFELHVRGLGADDKWQHIETITACSIDEASLSLAADQRRGFALEDLVRGPVVPVLVAGNGRAFFIFFHFLDPGGDLVEQPSGPVLIAHLVLSHRRQ